MPDSWSPQGNAFLFTLVKGAGSSLWTFSLKDRKAAPFGGVQSSAWTNAVFSPDGRWVAYAASGGGPRFEGESNTVLVQPFPATARAIQSPAAVIRVGRPTDGSF